MAQIAIYLDKEVQSKMDRAAKVEGKTRSAWVKDAILQKIQAGLPEGWFKLWGSWEDDRSPREIMQDIRAHLKPSRRKAMK